MKTLFFALCTFFLLNWVSAQPPDTWKILLNNKVIASGKSDKADSAVHLKASLLKKTDKIILSYSTANANPGWNRTFFINNEKDESLVTLPMSKQSGSVYMNADRLKKLIAKTKSFYIYTISLPKDRSLAARVRVARVLLGKIEWAK
jgi:hypothetical protein